MIHFQAMKPILIVHGGAGDIAQSRVQGKLDGVRLAVREGYRVLQHNGSALDAVEAAVVSMEKDENFNAGLLNNLKCKDFWTIYFNTTIILL